MLEPIEGESLTFYVSGGKAGKERLANCSGAEHLLWQDAKLGDRLTVHFYIAEAGRYSVELNLAMSPNYGKHRISVNGNEAAQEIDGYSPKLYWQRPRLGVFNLRAGDNTLEVETLEPNMAAQAGNRFGMDYIFLIKQSD